MFGKIPFKHFSLSLPQYNTCSFLCTRWVISSLSFHFYSLLGTYHVFICTSDQLWMKINLWSDSRRQTCPEFQSTPSAFTQYMHFHCWLIQTADCLPAHKVGKSTCKANYIHCLFDQLTTTVHHNWPLPLLSQSCFSSLGCSLHIHFLAQSLSCIHSNLAGVSQWLKTTVSELLYLMYFYIPK